MSDLTLVSTAADVRRAGAGSRLLALGWEAEEALRRHGLAHQVFDDMLDEQTFREATERAFSWATEWYRAPRAAAALDVAGVSLGRAMEYPLYYFFLTALRTTVTARAMLERERPGRVVSFAKGGVAPRELVISEGDGFYGEAFAEVARQAGIGSLPRRAALDARRGWSRVARAAEVRRIRVGGVTLPVPVGVVKAALGALAGARPAGVPAGLRGAICFLSYDGGIHPLYAPVVDALCRAGRRDLLALVFEPGLRRPGADGVRRVAVADLVPRAEQRRLREAYRDRWTTLDTDLAGAFVAGGTDLWPLVRPRLRAVFEERLAPLAAVVLAVQRLAAESRLAVLVAVNEIAEYFRAAMLAGDAAGVRSLTLLHGVPTKLHRHFIGNEPLLATRMAVWGEGCRTVKVQNGSSPDRLVVTGAPHLERLVREAARPAPSASVRVAALRALGIDPARKLVVFAPDHFNIGKLTWDVTLAPAQHTAYVRAVLEALGRVPDAQLLIKLKADDRSGPRIHGLIRRYGPSDARVVPAASWATLFPVADALVIAHSTVGLEALAYGVPVITVNLTGRPDRVDFAKEGAALGVYEAAALAPALSAALFDAETRARLREAAPAFLASYAGAFDGDAATRIARLAEELAG